MSIFNKCVSRLPWLHCTGVLWFVCSGNNQWTLGICEQILEITLLYRWRRVWFHPAGICTRYYTFSCLDAVSGRLIQLCYLIALTQCTIFLLPAWNPLDAWHSGLSEADHSLQGFAIPPLPKGGAWLYSLLFIHAEILKIISSVTYPVCLLLLLDTFLQIEKWKRESICILLVKCSLVWVSTCSQFAN